LEKMGANRRINATQEEESNETRERYTVRKFSGTKGKPTREHREEWGRRTGT